MTMSNIVIVDGQNIQCTLNNPDPLKLSNFTKKNFALVSPQINRIFYILSQYFVTVLTKNYALARLSKSKLQCKCNFDRNSSILNSCYGAYSVK